jgi:hypothetical protein
MLFISDSEMKKMKQNFVEPMDEQEQVRVINELKAQATTQTQQSRYQFSMLFMLFAGVFCISAVYSTFYPWQMEHQKHFQTILPHWIFVAHYMVSAFCFYVSALVVKVTVYCLMELIVV